MVRRPRFAGLSGLTTLTPVGAFEPQISFVTTADDRVLEVAVAGPVDGTPLFFHHGTPGAAALFEPNVEMGAERGLRHIAYSRPGYGGSTRMEGRTVADCAADVAAIADAMQLERFHTLGGSGGGPHSLACARLLGNRVISAATIASCAPMDAESLDWTAGMGKENLAEFAAVRAGDIALKEYLEGEVQAMAGTTGEQVVAALGDLISDVDRRALSGDFGDHVARQLARALSSGVSGWLDDDKAFFSDWGFDLAPGVVPVSIWHGSQDRFVPISHGEWLAAHIAGARVYLRPHDGHLSLTVDSYGRILDDLLTSD